MNITSKLFDYTYKNQIPLLCTFELTQKCNLNCLHCYIDSKTSFRNDLSTTEVKATLKQLANMGCLYVVFTGGEPLLRKDFLELCEYARKLKFDLRIFSNATLLTPAIANSLAKLKISGFETSIYGKESIHDKITGKKGSFLKSIDSLKLLKSLKVPISIKTPVMELNYGEIGFLQKLSMQLKAQLRLDITISPKNSGSKSNLCFRLKPEKLKKLGLLDSLTKEANTKGGDSDFICSAGHNLLAITHDGKVLSCLQLLLPFGNLRKNSLKTIWSSKTNKEIKKYRSITLKNVEICASCSSKSICQRCPGLALLEDGNLLGPSSISCQIAGCV